MDVRSPRFTLLVAMICLVVALVFQLIGIGGVGWEVNGDTDQYIGLFRQ